MLELYFKRWLGLPTKEAQAGRLAGVMLIIPSTAQSTQKAKL